MSGISRVLENLPPLLSAASRPRCLSLLEDRALPPVSPQFAETRTGTCNNEDAAAEKFYAVEGVVSRLALRDRKALENAWCRWLKLYRDWQHTLIAAEVP